MRALAVGLVSPDLYAARSAAMARGAAACGHCRGRRVGWIEWDSCFPIVLDCAGCCVADYARRRGRRKAKKRRPEGRLHCFRSHLLEVEVERHLNLAGAADGVLYDAEAGRAAIEGVGRGAVRLALLRGGSYPAIGVGSIGRIVITSVLSHVICRNIETGRVRHVVDVEGIAERVLVAKTVRSSPGRRQRALVGLAEDVALPVGEGGFKVVSSGHAIGAWRNQRKREAGRLEAAPPPVVLL